MATALVADAHLGGPGGSGEQLAEQLEELADSDCQRLLLLGDLFHVWVGDARYETPEITLILGVLRRLRAAGLEIVYIEGNRDFFIAGSCYGDAFSEIGLEFAFEVGGCRYLAVHGDGLNDRDWRYRFWRWLSKSAPSRFLSRRLPRGLARRIVHSTEKTLARSNFKHKSNVPREVISRFAERRLSEGHDVLLLGHFHDQLSWPVEGGEVRVVDAWYNAQRILWLGAGVDR